MNITGKFFNSLNTNQQTARMQNNFDNIMTYTELAFNIYLTKRRNKLTDAVKTELDKSK